MSIFPINDIDNVFVNILSIDELLLLSNINWYYNNYIKKIKYMNEYKILKSKPKQYIYNHIELALVLSYDNLVIYYLHNKNIARSELYGLLFICCDNNKLNIIKIINDIIKLNYNRDDKNMINECMKRAKIWNNVDIIKWLQKIE